MLKFKNMSCPNSILLSGHRAGYYNRKHQSSMVHVLQILQWHLSHGDKGGGRVSAVSATERTAVAIPCSYNDTMTYARIRVLARLQGTTGLVQTDNTKSLGSLRTSARMGHKKASWGNCTGICPGTQSAGEKKTPSRHPCSAALLHEIYYKLLAFTRIA